MLPRSVEVAAYPSSLEAGFAVGLLRAAGIPAEIDGLSTQSWGIGTVPITGYRVYVPRAHEAGATEVLRAEPVLAPEDAEAEGGPNAGEASAAPLEAASGDATQAEGAEPDAAEGAPAALAHAGGDWRLGDAPRAAWLLGLYLWLPITQGVACVWALELLLRPPGPGAPTARRGTLWALVLFAGLGCYLASRFWWPDTYGPSEPLGPIDLWPALDVALALTLALGWRARRVQAA